MYCPSCGNDIAADLRYCNRCGTNVSLPSAGSTTLIAAPVKLTIPSIVLGLTITIGLGLILTSAVQFARLGVHPTAIVGMVLFSAAMLFGCTALMIRFWTKLLTLQRETVAQQPSRHVMAERPVTPQLQPRREPGASVTENTTRTFSPAYHEPADRGPR